MQIEKYLWERIANDDQHAYAEVFGMLYKRLYNYGRKFSSNESLIEDVIQETLLSVWTKRGSLSSIEYPVTYFFTSFRNSLFTRLKSNQKIVSEEQISEEPEFGIDQIIVGRETDLETKTQIEKALNQLTSRQKEAIFLRFYEGMSYEQVAAMLGITVKATYKIMARALEQLREVLHFSPCLLFFLLAGTNS